MLRKSRLSSKGSTWALRHEQVGLDQFRGIGGETFTQLSLANIPWVLKKKTPNLSWLIN